MKRLVRKSRIFGALLVFCFVLVSSCGDEEAAEGQAPQSALPTPAAEPESSAGGSKAPSETTEPLAEVEEGRIAAMVHGSEVSDEKQEELGLVKINTVGRVVDGGTSGCCSGTLLNSHWVLTARNCVTTNKESAGPLLTPNEITITAAWALGLRAVPTYIREISANVPTPHKDNDIVLLYLGNKYFGNMVSQRIYSNNNGRLRASDVVVQYGRGYFTFASGIFGTPSEKEAEIDGKYRSAQFTPTPVNEKRYDLLMNSQTQVGHGGDTGGPTLVMVNGVNVGIAGVASSCTVTGYLPNAPKEIQWATGISKCQYASTERFYDEITNAIKLGSGGGGAEPFCSISSPVTTLPGSGGAYTFHTNCSGTPNEYAWTVNGHTEGKPKSAELIYTFPANNSADTRYFTVAVTPSNGFGAGSPAQITLSQPPLVSRSVYTLKSIPHSAELMQ